METIKEVEEMESTENTGVEVEVVIEEEARGRAVADEANEIKESFVPLEEGVGEMVAGETVQKDELVINWEVGDDGDVVLN